MLLSVCSNVIYRTNSLWINNWHSAIISRAQLDMLRLSEYASKMYSKIVTVIALFITRKRFSNVWVDARIFIWIYNFFRKKVVTTRILNQSRVMCGYCYIDQAHFSTVKYGSITIICIQEKDQMVLYLCMCECVYVQYIAKFFNFNILLKVALNIKCPAKVSD